MKMILQWTWQANKRTVRIFYLKTFTNFERDSQYKLDSLQWCQVKVLHKYGFHLTLEAVKFLLVFQMKATKKLHLPGIGLFTFTGS